MHLDYSRFQSFATDVAQRNPAALVVTTISAARAAQAKRQRLRVIAVPQKAFRDSFDPQWLSGAVSNPPPDCLR